MSNDQYQEVLGVIITGIMIFILLIGVVVFIMLFYQKKKFLHLEEKRTLQEAYQKQLLQSRLELQEEIFNTISQEIHDNVGQLLSLAKVQVNIVKQNEALDHALLEDIKINLGQAITDLRDIAKSLSTDRIQLIPLPQAVEQELQRMSKGGVMTYQIHIHGTEQPLDEQKKVILFRIIQESLQNILKHAQADEMQVRFQFDEKKLHIQITDNGAGFDPLQTKQGGLGLPNMKNRVALIGGEVSIQSALTQGTTIRLTVPYE